MDLILIQSQEHETLPIAELKAVLETEDIDMEIEVITNGLIVLKSSKSNDFYNSYKILTQRLAYTHEIHKILSRTDLENLENDFVNIDWIKHIDIDFAVRLKRFNKVDINTTAIEKRLGHLILKAKELNKNYNTNNHTSYNNIDDNNNSNNNNNNHNYVNDYKVNLENPNSFIRVIATENEVFVAIEEFKLNKKHFQEIKPHKRPFFYPGSMSPKLARCMVNLAHIKKGEKLLDPFCGTGGILIEAGIIGAKIIGSDIKWKMKDGTIKNLKHCNLEDYHVYNIDVRELKLYKKVDAVVTDPPYGISTSTGGEESEKIFHQFLESISRNMRENGRLCIAHPHYLDFDSILTDLNFNLIERHEIKMHKSLTRIISVIIKDNLIKD